MKLNGWQRIWVVATVLWAVPVLFVTYSNWPTGRNISNEDVFKRMNPADARQLTESPEDSRQLKDVVQRMIDAGESEENIATVIRGETVEVEGHLLRFAPKPADSEMNRIARDFYEGLQIVLRVRRAAFAGGAFAAWATGAALVYALGGAVAWIRRGFARSG